MSPRSRRNLMKILFFADVVGKGGVAACGSLLDKFRKEYRADFTIVNVENAAESGVGVGPDEAEAIREAGADCMTTGNHIWRRQRIIPFLRESDRLLRPANHKKTSPGKGFAVHSTKKNLLVGVLNLQGAVFMSGASHPFETADACVKKIRQSTPVIFVDFHAEATSEKVALGRHLDGLVTAVVGTHTHVQTADEQILPGGTAYITDVGMTGPYDSVIGVDSAASIARFKTGKPAQFKPAPGVICMDGVLVTLDPSTGKAHSIERIKRFYDPDKGVEVEKP